jgi:hypothetical protein
VQEDTARCRGVDEAVKLRSLPWVDWQNYWATGDSATQGPQSFWRFKHLNPNGRGIDGAFLDIEYQRSVRGDDANRPMNVKDRHKKNL